MVEYPYQCSKCESYNIDMGKYDLYCKDCGACGDDIRIVKSLYKQWLELADPKRRIQLSCKYCIDRHIIAPFNCSCKCHTIEFVQIICRDLQVLFDGMSNFPILDIKGSHKVETIDEVRKKVFGDVKL